MNEQDTSLHHLQSFPCTAALPATRYRAGNCSRPASLQWSSATVPCANRLPSAAMHEKYSEVGTLLNQHCAPFIIIIGGGAKGSDKVMAYPMPLLYGMEIPFVGICIRLGNNRSSANDVGRIWDLVEGRTALTDICVNESLGFKAWPCGIGYTFGCI